MSFRVVVLVSGVGTLLKALIDATKSGQCPVEIVSVGSDREDAYGLVQARNAGIETFSLPLIPYAKPGTASRMEWDEKFSQKVASYTPDLVVLAGFMKLFSAPFMRQFAGKTINSHPSLLPAFPGAHAVRDALAAGVKQTGASIFWVDDGIDTGNMIEQIPVPVLPGDDEPTLHERIKTTERQLLVKVVTQLAEGNKK